MKKTKISHLLILSCAVIGTGLVLSQFVSFGKNPDKAQLRQLPQVTATTTQLRDLPVEFSAQGHIVPLNQVDVRPQITASIRSVDFHEGDQIHAGQLLFTLDNNDTTAQLNRVQAQAAQIQAQLDDAKRDYNRSRELVKSDFIAPSAVDTAASKVESLQAQLRASRADIASAQVQLSYTRITAPISAQAGALTVHPGSLAQQSASAPLLSLIQFDPIAAEFSLPEQALSQIVAARQTGTVTVVAETPGGKPVEGTLTFVNNTVSSDTGTISLKANFPNPGKSLWPGAFTRITLRAGVSKGAVVLPPQAVLEGPKGRFVYMIGADSKVSAMPVKLLRMQDQDAVIGGLPEGVRVVRDGGHNLRAGAAVRVAAQADVQTEVQADPKSPAVAITGSQQ